MNRSRCFLALGSNLGDRRENLRQALARVSCGGDLEIVAVSRLYETAPVGPPQGPYYNAVAEIVTGLAPEELLARCRSAENAGGRQRTVRWGPRTIDIDILDCGGMVRETAELRLPHPEMARRAFVLVPLRDVAPDWVHPVEHRSVGELMEALGDTGGACVVIEGSGWFVPPPGMRGEGASSCG